MVKIYYSFSFLKLCVRSNTNWEAIDTLVLRFYGRKIISKMAFHKMAAAQDNLSRNDIFKDAGLQDVRKTTFPETVVSQNDRFQFVPKTGAAIPKTVVPKRAIYTCVHTTLCELTN